MEIIEKTGNESNATLLLERLIAHYSNHDVDKPLRLMSDEIVGQNINESLTESEIETEVLLQGNNVLLFIGKHACAEHPTPDIFFPYKRMKRYRDAVDKAQEACSNCIEKVECLDGALKRKEEFGVWGETTEYERDQYLKGKTNSPGYLKIAAILGTKSESLIDGTI